MHQVRLTSRPLAGGHAPTQSSFSIEFICKDLIISLLKSKELLFKKNWFKKKET